MKARAKELKAAEEEEGRALRARGDVDRRSRPRQADPRDRQGDPLSTSTPKTWYGMPAYANKDGKVVLYFRNAEKFKERYAMLGFNDAANLDDRSMWPVAFALTKLTKADEARIAKLLKQAVS